MRYHQSQDNVGLLHSKRQVLFILDVQANAGNNPEVGQEEEGEDEEEEEENGDESDSEETGDGGETDDVNITSDSNDSSQQPEHPGYLVITYNFVTTFFTSLVPQGPRVIAQA